MSSPQPIRTRSNVGTWELDDFFRDLRSTLIALEEAWKRGELAPKIAELTDRPEAHPAILASYRRLERGPRIEPVPYRERAIRALVERAKRQLFELPHRFEARAADFPEPRRRFVATPEARPAAVQPGTAPPGETPTAAPQPPAGKDQPRANLSTKGQPPKAPPAGAEARGALESEAPKRLHGLAVKSKRGECYLRLDQVISAREWGVGFFIDDAEVSDAVTTEVAHATVEELAYSLVGVEKIHRRMSGRELDGELELIPPPDGRRFESLVHDILNEHYPCARHAPMVEDFFEKTDLRLHARGLDRRRGARVQVTSITDAAQHAEKLERIHNLEEFVVLSPVSLAEAMANHDSGLDREEEMQFWRCFDSPPDSTRALARALRGCIANALERPFAGPRGPLAAVPEPVRMLVQTYAHQAAFRTTARMRARLQTSAQRSAESASAS